MAKWQPVMVILEEGQERLECKCGSLAIFVCLFQTAEEVPEGHRDLDYDTYCQTCFQKAQESEKEE
jgi:uncharacterized protein (DUF169 family)